MTYLVTARKWRPMVFEDVVGQSHVATTLRNAIASNRLSHSYIFSGPRGVGKTTMARILAKAINCLEPKDFNPDNQCDICVSITDGRSLDVLEIDGASNRGVDEIRNLRESVRYAPTHGKYKVYIIDEVHMLTKEAFNALLKTLEEPPPHILFIFATTEPHKVPATILSRCQRFDFRRISIEEITKRLRFIAGQEKITIDDDALIIIAKKGDGSLRDAQSIFDQIVSFSSANIDAQQVMHALNIVDEELYFRVTDLIRANDTKGGLVLVEEIMARGYDVREFIRGLNEHFRNMLVVLATKTAELIETSEAFKKRYLEEAPHFSDGDLFRLIKIGNEMDMSLRWSDQPRIRLEVGLLQMIRMDSSVRIDTLLEGLEDLKKNGATPREVAVSGTVSASPPRSLVAQQSATTRTAPSTSSAPSFTKPIPSAVPPRTQPLSPAGNAVQKPGQDTISLHGTEEKWKMFVQTAASQKVMIGTILRKATCTGVENDIMRVACPDDMDISLLKQNREYLTDLAHQIYGAKIRLETIHSPDNGKQHTADHPIIAALKRELGAQPIE